MKQLRSDDEKRFSYAVIQPDPQGKLLEPSPEDLDDVLPRKSEWKAKLTQQEKPPQQQKTGENKDVIKKKKHVAKVC